jgi:hypothetical protein
MHGVLSTKVDRKKDCFDPVPLALLLSGLICRTLYTLSYCVLFSSVLFCFVTSCLVLYHAVLTHIALFLCFTVPYSSPFYVMRHCDVTQCYTAQCTLFCVYFVLKTYLTIVLLYTHWSVTPYNRSTTRHGACVTLQFSISTSTTTVLCSLSGSEKFPFFFFFWWMYDKFRGFFIRLQGLRSTAIIAEMTGRPEADW